MEWSNPSNHKQSLLLEKENLKTKNNNNNKKKQMKTTQNTIQNSMLEHRNTETQWERST